MKDSLRKTLLLGVILPAVGYLVVHFTLLDRSPPSPIEELGIDPTTVDVDTLSPQLAAQLGLHSKKPATELVAVVISAKTCVANRIEGFHEAMKRIPRLLQTQIADQPDMVARIVGIALDPDARTGAEYLFDLAEFDEVIAGGDWLNTATEKYFWGTYALPGSIPQVVILQRRVTWLDNSVTVEQEQLLKTFNGADEIIDWVARGAPTGAVARGPAEGAVP